MRSGRRERIILFLQWTPYLSVGISVIDNQHIELFSRFNRLLEALTQGNAREELVSLADFLEEYVAVHFGKEQELMDLYSYAGAEGHKAQHAGFVSDLASLKGRLETSGASVQLAVDTLKRLGDWLLKHIGASDQHLGRFLKVAMFTRKAA